METYTFTEARTCGNQRISIKMSEQDSYCNVTLGCEEYDGTGEENGLQVITMRSDKECKEMGRHRRQLKVSTKISKQEEHQY
eukprot:4524738-Pleurochrysis_carterae.AAC.1